MGISWPSSLSRFVILRDARRQHRQKYHRQYTFALARHIDTTAEIKSSVALISKSSSTFCVEAAKKLGQKISDAGRIIEFYGPDEKRNRGGLKLLPVAQTSLVSHR